MQILIHMLLEGIGSLVGIYAYRYCEHNWHRVAIWVSLTALTSIITVQIVG
jgi:NADH:ubiquinone oxidoreductase subunit 5 (subunit L)/multisubunit Na+/H+ antiporter MnhA subunit